MLLIKNYLQKKNTHNNKSLLSYVSLIFFCIELSTFNKTGFKTIILDMLYGNCCHRATITITISIAISNNIAENDLL